MRPDGPQHDLVIFDCDGVLVDSEVLSLKALHEMLLTKGLDLAFDTLTEKFLGRSLAHERAVLQSEYDITLSDLDVATMSDRLYAAFRAELQPVPGVAAAIAQLSGPRCVASSSQPERIALSLETTGLAEFFGANVFSAAQVARGA